MKHLISFAVPITASTTTTLEPSAAACIAGDFELIGLLNSTELTTACPGDLYDCMNAQISAMDGYTDRTIEKSCFDSIWNSIVQVNTAVCSTDSDSDAKKSLCGAFAFFEVTDVQAALVPMDGSCSQEDFTNLSSGNYSALASCLADDELNFETCLESYPLDASGECDSCMSSALTDIEDNCSGLCGIPPDYSGSDCLTCLAYGLPAAASYCAYNSASSIMSISFAGLLFILLFMN